MEEKRNNDEVIIPYLIDELPKYAELKKQSDDLTKEVKGINEEIKKCMVQNELDTYTTGGYKATYSVQKRNDVDEEGLLKYLLAQLGGEPDDDIVKTKPYVDFDALESAIYNHKIASDIVEEMQKFIKVKEVPTLKVSKVKEGN